MKKTTVFVILIFICIQISFADKFVRERVSAKKVEKNVEKLEKTIRWHRNFDELKAEAKKKNKMVFWMQLVGDLNGGL